MGDHDRQAAGAPAPDVPQLAESLQRIAAAIDQARALGLPVSVPESLYLACLAVVNRHDHPEGGSPPGTGPTGPTEPEHQTTRRGGSSATASPVPASTSVKVRDVPLRRLIWQVINPGEEFTVTDVAERVAALGATWPPSAVSNALGYWVSRSRLTREHKGVYSYPQPPSVAAALEDERARQQERPADSPSRAATARGEEDNDVSISFAHGKAAS